MQAAALDTVSVSNTQFQFFMTKLSMDRLKQLAMRATQPMCCIFDPHGHASNKKKGGACAASGRVRVVVMRYVPGFKTLEVKCPQRWKSHKVTLWLHSSGFVKIVATKSKEEAVRVAVSFEQMVQAVRGFGDVCLLQQNSVELSEWRVHKKEHLLTPAIAGMMKADMDLQLPEKINLHKMAEMLGDRAEFEPELYMGLKVQWSDTLKLILFSTGKIMICPMVVERNRAELENTPVAYLCHQVSPFVHMCLDSYKNQ